MVYFLYRLDAVLYGMPNFRIILAILRVSEYLGILR